MVRFVLVDGGAEGPAGRGAGSLLGWLWRMSLEGHGSGGVPGELEPADLLHGTGVEELDELLLQFLVVWLAELVGALGGLGLVLSGVASIGVGVGVLGFAGVVVAAPVLIEANLLLIAELVVVVGGDLDGRVVVHLGVLDHLR